ncbi:MAG TPA: TonB-dependent receptor [Bryobacteraceae bacterium]|nr:TonB-dependent receptor [Bryobacteraceae bacterium]
MSALVAAMVLGVPGPRLRAQEVAVAQVGGVVSDPSGAPIAGAQVRMTETSKGLVRSTLTDGQGRYALPNLPVGPYQLEVTASGFKSYLQSGIVLQVGNNVEVNVPMQLGSLSESVEVTAGTTMVETRENTVSQVIDERRIVDLPLNGRQPTQLILLSGAALTTPGGDMRGSKNFWSSTTISVAGGQGNGVNYLLDGGDNNDSFTNVNLPIPFPDALQEFSVETSSLPARYGLHPGAVVNAVTKSGTNSLHGDLFEFLRNGDVNARNFFAPVHDSLKRNQFGGTLGGRIIRDKLFFFGGFQGTFNRQDPPQSISYVPTAAALGGDFSVIDSGACVSGGKGKTILDPTTGQPFANNQIPASRLNPQSVNLAKYLPAAQNDCGKVTYGIPTTGDEDQGVLRIDWVQNAKHTLYGRYYIADYRNPSVFDGKNLLTTTQAGNLERAQTLTLGDNYTISSNTLNAFHATATRRRDDRGAPGNDINPHTVGIDVPAPVPNFIQASVSGYFSVGCGTCANAFFNVNSLHLADDLDVIRGKHQMAFGVDYIRDQFNSLNAWISNGSFSFNGLYASGKNMGDALAAYMLGAMNDFTQSANLQNATRGTVFALYAQDSIRLTPHLTVNLGLRWDPTLVPYDYFHRGNSFSLAAFEAGQRSKVFTNAPAGLLFYGDPGIPPGFQHNRLANLSPRAGIVWDPSGSGRQTIRVSGAILRDTEEMFYNERLTTNSPYGTQVDLPYPFPSGGTLTNPWAAYPGGTPFPLPSPLPSTFNFPNAGVYVTLPMDLTPTYMAQWNVSYQRQIAPDWLASVSYLGNKTTHVWVGEDINPAQYIPGNSASTNLRRPLYLQNPKLGAAYSSITASDQNANAHYNALLLSLQHRFSQGFTLLTNYTWSHCLSDSDFTGELAGSQYMNPYNRAADYGNCNFDLRHQSNTSLIVTSPVKGNGLAGRILGEWRLSPIISVHSGLPMNITTGTDISQTGINADRPNLTLSDAYLAASDPRYYLNRAAFQNQAPGTFGNLGRDVLIAPGAVNVDFALSRLFHYRERWQVEARAEAFNAINHANFNAPTTNLSNSKFGVIQGAGDPRILQFAMKLYF